MNIDTSNDPVIQRLERARTEIERTLELERSAPIGSGPSEVEFILDMLDLRIEHRTNRLRELEARDRLTSEHPSPQPKPIED